MSSKKKMSVAIAYAATGAVVLLGTALWFFDPQKHGLEGMKQLVHPYNETFSKMLKKSHRADLSRLD